MAVLCQFGNPAPEAQTFERNVRPSVGLAENACLPEFAAVQNDLAALPGGVIANGQRRALLQKMANAQQAYEQGRPCTAANILSACLNQIQALHRGQRLALAELVFNRVWSLYYQILVGLSGQSGCPGHPPAGQEPAVTVTASDNLHVQAGLAFGPPKLWTVAIENQTFTQLRFPGLAPGAYAESSGEVGRPALPRFSLNLAVPLGAEPALRLDKQKTYDIRGVNLYPAQTPPVDAPLSANLPGMNLPETPFILDEAAYQQDAFFPEKLAELRELGQIRDVRIFQIRVAPARYNPAQKTLTILEELEFEVIFQGGTGSFVTTRSLNPFEAFNFGPLVQNCLINGDIIFDRPFPDTVPRLDVGEELLIITHPDFLAAAHDLKNWKREKGIATKVFATGPADAGGIGSSKEEIRAFIKSRYDRNVIRPSYVLLLGDAEFIPVWYRSTSSSPTAGTDLDYALMTEDDTLADLGIARIPVDLPEQAQTVVDKIINYEKHPPSTATFYTSAALASYFECCRTMIRDPGWDFSHFIETSETVRNALLTSGYTVERLYTANDWEHPSYFLDPTPRAYYDGTPLPDDLGPESGFAWDADSEDIITSINAGRFLFVHKDHGSPWAWGYPWFHLSDIDTLANGPLLPVFFGVSCGNGFFDNETASGEYGSIAEDVPFIEAFLSRSSGGIVGALAATRNTFGTANDPLLLGFADAVFPNVVPGFGGPVATHVPARTFHRLADILNYGKLYMYSQVSGEAADNNNVTYHAFGDPTQEIWTSRPLEFPRNFRMMLEAERMLVEFSVDGAQITAIQEVQGQEIPLGRGVVANSRALLPYVAQPLPGAPIRLSVSKPGYVGASLTAPIFNAD
jgi:hypothetical protein